MWVCFLCDFDETEHPHSWVLAFCSPSGCLFDWQPKNREDSLQATAIARRNVTASKQRRCVELAWSPSFLGGGWCVMNTSAAALAKPLTLS